MAWQNIGLGANWLIPFGLAVEPAPTASDPLRYNILVPDEGYGMVFRLDDDGHFLAAPLAENLGPLSSLHVITFAPPVPPDQPPARSNGQPTGVLAVGTTQATMSLTTDEPATCRYSTQPGVAYASMTNTFTTTGATTHSTVAVRTDQRRATRSTSDVLTPLGNANTDDFVIAFSVASPSATTSNFVGVESPLSEGGKWDSPGAWASLAKE